MHQPAHVFNFLLVFFSLFSVVAQLQQMFSWTAAANDAARDQTSTIDQFTRRPRTRRTGKVARSCSPSSMTPQSTNISPRRVDPPSPSLSLFDCISTSTTPRRSARRATRATSHRDALQTARRLKFVLDIRPPSCTCSKALSRALPSTRADKIIYVVNTYPP